MKTKLLYLIATLFISFASLSAFASDGIVTMKAEKNRVITLYVYPENAYIVEGAVFKEELEKGLKAYTVTDDEGVVTVKGTIISLVCAQNGLTAIDLSKCPLLEDLSCTWNELTELNLENNSELIRLYCSGNQLKTLDLSNCVNLSILECSSNELGTIDLSKNNELTKLKCANTGIVELDLSPCKKLKTLEFNTNGLTAIDLSP